MAKVIEMTGISKSYGKGEGRVEVLKKVSLSVEEGEFVAILGPSGSGKTTLMNLIGLIDAADEGSYKLDGTEITSLKDKNFAKMRNKKIGFVFQKFNLIPKYTALYNVALPVLLNGKSYGYSKKQAKLTMERVGLADKMKSKPNQLSGGQMQRVAIARALVGGCSLILADEPTGALDKKTGNEVLDFIQELNREEGKTILMITHDASVAERADRIIKVEDGAIVE